MKCINYQFSQWYHRYRSLRRFIRGAFSYIRLKNPPGNVAEVFAPGIVSTGMHTRDIAMTPDLKEIYFSVSIGYYTYSTILCIKKVNGKWTGPEVPEFASDLNYKYAEPAIYSDGRKFYFVSNMPNTGENKTDMDIWVMDREGDK